MGDDRKSGAARLAESARLDLIRAIESKRGSRVIAYVTADREGLASWFAWEDVRVVEQHLRAVMRSNPKRLDLFLATNGGEAVAPWRLLSMIREFLGGRPFNVLAPSRAMSAGAEICLGADEIVMGPAGVIGPIDTQSFNAETGARHSVENVAAYFELLDDIGLDNFRGRLAGFMALAQSVSPLSLGRFHRVAREGERVAARILSSRRNPLSQKANHQIARTLLRGIGLHGQAISRSEARDIGITFVRNAEDEGIDEAMSDLYAGYEDLLKIETPFVRGPMDGETAAPSPFAVDGAPAHEQPVAVVESLDRLDIAKSYDYHRFWREPPPEAPPTEPSIGAGAEAGAGAAARRERAAIRRPQVIWSAERSPAR